MYNHSTHLELSYAGFRRLSVYVFFTLALNFSMSSSVKFIYFKTASEGIAFAGFWISKRKSNLDLAPFVVLPSDAFVGFSTCVGSVESAVWSFGTPSALTSPFVTL